MTITKAPDVNPSEPAARYTDSLGKYIVIYLCLLAIAGAQFAIAYEHIDITAMFGRMFFLAFIEAGLAVMFFMHMWAEKRGFFLAVAILTIFVLGAMQYGWTDSFRTLLGHAPYSAY